MSARQHFLADRLLAGAAGVAMVALTATVLLGVITRALGDPLIFTDEVSRFLMIWVACLGWMLATRNRSHIRIRFFFDKLPEAGRRWAEIIMQFLIALFGLLLIAHGSELMRRNFDIEATTVPLSMAVVYAPVVLGGLVALIEACVAARDSFRTGEAGK